jgi:hypothetical protein
MVKTNKTSGVATAYLAPRSGKLGGSGLTSPEINQEDGTIYDSSKGATKGQKCDRTRYWVVASFWYLKYSGRSSEGAQM